MQPDRSSGPHEVVTVDQLEVGDVMKIGRNMMEIAHIQEFPKVRRLRLRRYRNLFPWETDKRRTTLVYREVRR